MKVDRKWFPELSDERWARLPAALRKMIVVLLLGHMGAGKSHFVIQNVRRNTFVGPVGYLGNEEAGEDSADVRVIANEAEIKMFPGGCFSCKKPDEVRRRVVEMAQKGTKTILAECLGVSIGADTLQLLREMGCEVHVITLIGAPFYGNARVMGVMRHQIALATDGVFVTRSEEVPDVMPEIERYVLAHANGRPLRRLNTDAELPDDVLMRLLPDEEEAPLFTVVQPKSRQGHALIVQGHVHDAHCAHEHHDHNHEVDPYPEKRNFVLRTDGDFGALQAVIDSFRLDGNDQIGRAKFADSTFQWNCTLNDAWRKASPDSGRPYLIVYAVDGFDFGVFDQFIDRSELSAPTTEEAIVQGDGATNEETEALLASLIERLPTDLQFALDGGLVTHPEVQQTAHLLGKRVSNSPLRAVQLRARNAYFLRCFEQLMGTGDKARELRAHPSYGSWVLAVVNGMSYFALYERERLGPELCLALDDRCQTFAVPYTHAFSGLTSLGAELPPAVSFTEEVEFVLDYLRNDPSLRTAIEHGYALAIADGRLELRDPWSRYLARFTA